MKELELIQKLMDALLSNQQVVVREALDSIEIKHIKKMGSLIIDGFAENDQKKIMSAQNLLESLGAQRNLSITQILTLIGKVNSQIEYKIKGPSVAEPARGAISVPAPAQSLHLSGNIIQELRTVLKDGLQQLKSASPGASTVAPAIDTSAIVSEIKSVISKEIKSISSEIVSQIINKLPVGLPSQSRARSGGSISDDVPEIRITAAAAGGEREARPKLDDMLDSIIVSE